MAATQESENLPIVKKKLNDLRVVDLRAELDKRELDKTGVKVALIERLSKALEDEGHDPEEYFFEVTGEITPSKKIQSKRVNKKLTNETESVVSAEGLDDSIIDDDDKIDSDDEKLAIDEKDDSFKDSNLKATIDEKGGEKQRNSSSAAENKKNGDGKLTNNNDGVFSSPKTESAPSISTNTDDTVNPDASGVVKSIDNASLIVHVDDQSDVDGDLDLTMCDTGSASGKGTPVNAEAAGNRETKVGKLLEEAVIIDDNDQTGDSNEVLELENEEEEEQPTVTEVKKTVKKETVSTNNSGTNSTAVSASTTADAKKPESKKSSETHHDAKEGGATKENAESGTTNSESNNATSASSKSKSNSASTSGLKEKVSDKDRSSSDRVKRVSVSSCNLWVSGLSASTKASDLRMLFSKYGRIIAAKIVSNAKMPGRRCYGFITMFSSEEASKCIQHLHRTELNGKMISVERTKNTLPGVMKTTKGAPASRKPPPRPHSKPSPESKKPEKPKTEAETETTEKKEKEPVKEEEKKEKPVKTVVVDAAEPSSGETKERDKSTDKSREKSREKSTREQSRERVRGLSRSFRDPRSTSARGSHYRDYRSRMGRGRPYGSRGRGRGGIMSSRGGMMHNDRGSFRKPFFSRRPMTSAYKPRGNMLTFQKIKEERLKQRTRQRERELRETERRRVQDMLRQKEIERKQREEALRLERERERLRIDREKLERERENILRLEREKQKLERERLEREREELRRREQLRLDEPRRPATKRPFEARANIRESEPYWDERKRPARAAPSGTASRFHNFEHGGRDRVSSFERHDTFDRRGTERFEARDKGERPEFDSLHRPGGRRGETAVPAREDRKVIEREHRFERPLVKEEFRGGREREVRGGNRAIRDPPIRRPPANDGWKSGSHDRRITDISRNDRYLVSGKSAVGVSSTGAYGGSGGGRPYGSERETWSGSDRSVGKSYGSSAGLLNPHWSSGDSRKLDSGHSPSWSSQSDRWGGASSLDTRNTRGQQSLGGPGALSQPQSSLYSSSVTPVISHSLGSRYGSDTYMPSMRRYN